MSDFDPTVFPPSWMGSSVDEEQHKVLTNDGLLHFLGDEIETEVKRFREWKDWAELPEEAKKLREALQRQEKHKVRVQDIGIAAGFDVVELSATTSEEVSSGAGIFHGISSGTAGVITVMDTASGQGSTATPLGVWSVGPAVPPVWFDRGILYRRGLWVQASVALNLSVYWRGSED